MDDRCAADEFVPVGVYVSLFAAATACDRALGQAVEHFASIDPAQQSWADFLDETMLAERQGDIYYKLSLAGRDPRAARRAVPLLRQAVDSFGIDFARPQATSLTALAGAHAIAGNTDTAVNVGHQAIDAVTALHSPHAHEQLRLLHTALEPLHTSAGVAELRDRVSTIAIKPIEGEQHEQTREARSQRQVRGQRA